MKSPFQIFIYTYIYRRLYIQIYGIYMLRIYVMNIYMLYVRMDWHLNVHKQIQ